MPIFQFLPRSRHTIRMSDRCKVLHGGISTSSWQVGLFGYSSATWRYLAHTNLIYYVDVGLSVSDIQESNNEHILTHRPPILDNKKLEKQMLDE